MFRRVESCVGGKLVVGGDIWDVSLVEFYRKLRNRGTLSGSLFSSTIHLIFEQDFQHEYSGQVLFCVVCVRDWS